jgi:flavodoxin
MRPLAPSRRALLHSVLLLGVGGWAQALAGCSTPSIPPSSTNPTSPDSTPTGGGMQTTGRTLMAYYSRPGENYFYGGRRNLEVGNTEVLARMIIELINCDVYRLEAVDPYLDGYDATVARNVAEQNADARPAIADPLASIDGYEHVLLGSPIWNVRPPMIMSTFTESHDFTSKTVYPFVTYAVSDLGSTERVYATSCAGARLVPGLAVRGEEVADHRDDVVTWLREAGLLTS